MLRWLGLLARHGRFVLVGGLVAGVALPGVAATLKPWLSELVLLLLFLTAFRVGLPATVQGLKQARSALGVVLVYQLGLPLLCLAGFSALGLAHTPMAIALTLMLAAPSVTGTPNMAVLLGHPPEPAFRVLILGTLMLPLTLIPIFWLSPALGNLPDALGVAIRLGVSISFTIALAFGLRALVRPHMPPDETRALDGLTSLALAVIVIGLMSAIAPAFSATPWMLAGWFVFAVVVNFGLQMAGYFGLRSFGAGPAAVPMSLVAGNRNVALFLVASSATQSDTFLVFLGCYQIPMYLTPLVMRPFYDRMEPQRRAAISRD